MGAASTYTPLFSCRARKLRKQGLVQEVASRYGVGEGVQRLQSEHDGNVSELQVKVQHHHRLTGGAGQGGRQVDRQDRFAHPSFGRKDTRHEGFTASTSTGLVPGWGSGQLFVQPVGEFAKSAGQLRANVRELDGVVDPGPQGQAHELGRRVLHHEDRPRPSSGF